MAFFQYRAADQAGKVVEGVMEAEVAAIMRQFFRERRDGKEKIN